MTDIHHASKQKPVLTNYEPGFRRIFARGTLLSHELSREPGEPDMLHLAFWSRRQDNIPIEDGVVGTGYHLETEAVMTWETAHRLQGLLKDYLEKHSRKAEPPKAEAPSTGKNPA